MILVIGNLEGWRREGRPVPQMEGFRFASFLQLGLDLMREVAPTLVLSSLVDDGHDATEIGRRLVELGYAGPYRALTAPLPDVEAVVAEVREAAPGLDFDLLVIGPQA